MSISKSRLGIAAGILLLIGAALVVGINVASRQKSSSSPQDLTPAAAQIENTRLKGQIQAIPSVVRVDGGYSHDASNSGGAMVLSITIQPGSDMETIATEALRLTWLSNLRPLGSTSITVGPSDNPRVAIDRHTDFVFGKADLTAKYGPRPR